MIFSPAISMPGDRLSLSPAGGTSLTTSPTNATAQWSLRSSGDIFATVSNNTVSDQGDWVTPKGNAANYEAKSTVTSGTFTADPSAGTWVALTADRTWTLTAAAVDGPHTAVATVEIRRAGTTTTLISASMTLTAEKQL